MKSDSSLFLFSHNIVKECETSQNLLSQHQEDHGLARGAPYNS